METRAVVSVKELLAVGASILDAAETWWEVGTRTLMNEHRSRQREQNRAGSTIAVSQFRQRCSDMAWKA
jgi:hypothetical protein